MADAAIEPGSELIQCVGQVCADGALVVTCEHADRIVPPPLQVHAADRRWLATHWGYDVGAAEVARGLVGKSSGVAVLARFSRLVCDTNREWSDPTCIRREVEGHVLQLNADLPADERVRRRRTLYEPYHAAVDRVLTERRRAGGRPFLLLAVHSFTPVLHGDRRPMELGILFDRHRSLADRLERRLHDSGYRTALNAPYSGLAGLIYSVTRHGSEHDVPYLELEVRQDLIATPSAARALGERLAPIISPLAAGA